MTIKTKIGVIFGTLLILFTLQAALLFVKTDHILHLSIDVKERYEPVFEKSYQLKVAVIQIQQWLTDISATRGLDGLNDGFDAAEENYQKAVSLIDELVKLDPAHSELYSGLLAPLDEYHTTGKMMANAYIQGGPADGNKVMVEFDAAATVITEKVEQLVLSAKQEAEDHLAQEEVAVTALENIVILSGVVFLLIIITSSLILFKVVLSPIKAMSELAKDLAEGDGDLTKRLNDSNKDELGIASHWINRFVAKSQGNIQTISQISAETERAVIDLAKVAEKANEGMEIQLQETEQVAVAMHEMVSTAEDVAQNAAVSSGETEEVKNRSLEGIQTIQEAAVGIRELVAEMDQAQKVIKQLGDESNNIGSVLDVIKGISEQTNLLALNAAIEAARAGEQGRGFAVVADEVRTLAARTQQSTEEIQQMITSFQQKTKEATQVIESGSAHAYTSVEKVNEVNNSLQTIGENVDRISMMSVQIATAAEEQSQVSHEIDRSISGITEAVKNSSNRVSVLRGTSEQMTSSLYQLNKLISQFKV